MFNPRRDGWQNDQQFDQMQQIAQEFALLRRQLEQRSGTWTPGYTFAGSAVGITYSAQSGYWLKQGALVICVGHAAMTNNGAGVGAAVLTGLPFLVKDVLSASTIDGLGHFVWYNNIGAALDSLFLYPVGGTNTAVIDRVAAAALVASVATDTDLTNTFDGRIFLMYQTDEE